MKKNSTFSYFKNKKHYDKPRVKLYKKPKPKPNQNKQTKNKTKHTPTSLPIP